MRKMIFPILLAGTLMLGGCAAGLGGNPIAGVLGSVLGGGLGTQGYGSVNTRFETAAVNACGEYASQYGRVSVTNVQQARSDTLRVDGRVSPDGYQQRRWACAFRADGRITDFRMG